MDNKIYLEDYPEYLKIEDDKMWRIQNDLSEYYVETNIKPKKIKFNKESKIVLPFTEFFYYLIEDNFDLRYKYSDNFIIYPKKQLTYYETLTLINNIFNKKIIIDDISYETVKSIKHIIIDNEFENTNDQKKKDMMIKFENNNLSLRELIWRYDLKFMHLTETPSEPNVYVIHINKEMFRF